MRQCAPWTQRYVTRRATMCTMNTQRCVYSCSAVYGHSSSTHIRPSNEIKARHSAVITPRSVSMRSSQCVPYTRPVVAPNRDQAYGVKSDWQQDELRWSDSTHCWQSGQMSCFSRHTPAGVDCSRLLLILCFLMELSFGASAESAQSYLF